MMEMGNPQFRPSILLDLDELSLRERLIGAGGITPLGVFQKLFESCESRKQSFTLSHIRLISLIPVEHDDVPEILGDEPEKVRRHLFVFDRREAHRHLILRKSLCDLRPFQFVSCKFDGKALETRGFLENHSGCIAHVTT